MKFKRKRVIKITIKDILDFLKKVIDSTICGPAPTPTFPDLKKKKSSKKYISFYKYYYYLILFEAIQQDFCYS